MGRLGSREPHSRDQGDETVSDTSNVPSAPLLNCSTAAAVPPLELAHGVAGRGADVSDIAAQHAQAIDIVDGVDQHRPAARLLRQVMSK
jgi:hypothetical protein